MLFLPLIIKGAPSPQVSFTFSNSSFNSPIRFVAVPTHTLAVTISWMKSLLRQLQVLRGGIYLDGSQVKPCSRRQINQAWKTKLLLLTAQISFCLLIKHFRTLLNKNSRSLKSTQLISQQNIQYSFQQCLASLHKVRFNAINLRNVQIYGACSFLVISYSTFYNSFLLFGRNCSL